MAAQAAAPAVVAQPAATNPGGAPNGPFGLSATASGPTTVALSFYDSSTNETGFVIQRATGSGGAYATIATPGAAAGSFTTVTYTDTTATAGTSYSYRVYAVNGPYSSSVATASVTTPGGSGGTVTAPAAPSGISAALSGSQIVVSFTDNSTNETDFVVQRSTTSTGTYATVGTGAGDGATGSKSFTDASVGAGATYYYKVYAENSAGVSSSAGPTAGVTTPSAGGATNPGGAPNGPFGFTATAVSATSVNLAFYDSSNNETGFVLQRSTSQNGTYATVATLPAAAGTSSTVSYTDTTTAGSTTYFYRVYAVNGPYQSSVASTTVTTPPSTGGGTVTAPAAPSGISAALSGSQVVVSFTDNANNESDLVVQRSTTSTGSYTTVGTVAGDAATGSKSFTDSSVAAGTTYYYKVYAENSAGVSASAGPTAAVTTPSGGGTTNPGGAPNGPFGLTASAASATVVNLAFYDSSTNETGFVVQRATGAGGVYATLATLPAAAGSYTTVTYADATAAGSTTYAYRVYAINGPYASSAAAASATTPAAAGGGTTTVTVGPNVDATKALGSEMESQIAVNPTNPNDIVLVAQNDVNGGNLINVSRSTDGGRTWTASTLGSAQDGFASNTPRPDARVAFDAFGNCYVVYMVAGSDGIHIVGLRSADGGATFTYTGSVAGGSAGGGVNPDDPALATGVYAGNAAVQGVWVIFDDDATGTVRLIGATSTGLGQFSGWGAVRTVSDAAGSYPSLAVGPAGQLAAAWQTASTGQGPNNIVFDSDSSGTGTGFGVDRVVGVTNVGGFDFIPAQPDRSIDAEVKLAFDTSNDATRGRLYLAYIDEPVDESNDTDVFLRSTDNLGASWTNALRVNNDATRNSQFLPALAVDPTTGNVGLTWYDARNSADDTSTQLYAAVSTDHGATFSNTRIAAGTSNQAYANPSGNDLDYGDNGTIAFYGGSLIAAWSDNSNSTGDNPNGGNSKFDVLTDVVSVRG